MGNHDPYSDRERRGLIIRAAPLWPSLFEVARGSDRGQTPRSPEPVPALARALIEEGLRRVLADRRARRGGFRLRRAAFKGKGLSPDFEGAEWTATRDAIYRGRGA